MSEHPTLYNPIEATLRARVEKDPKDLHATLQLGRHYQENQRTIDALKLYRAALEALPDEPRLHGALGAVLLGMDQLERAHESLERALALDPKDSLSLSNLGHIRTIQERFEEGEKLLSAAVTLAPHEPAFHNNLAALYARTGKMSEALEEARKALELNPDFVAARQNLGVAAFAVGKYPEAAEALDYVLDYDPNDIVALILGGQAHLRSGRKGEGIRRLHRLLQLAPHSEEGQGARQILDQMKEEHETFVGLAWKEAGLAADRGVEKINAEDFEGAEQDFLEAIALCPSAPPAAFYEALAASRAQSGRVLEACDAYYRGLAQVSDDPSLPLRFARFLMSIEDYFHAIVMLRETLERGDALSTEAKDTIIGIMQEVKSRLAQHSDPQSVESALQDYAAARKAQQEGRAEEARALVEKSINAYPRNLDACWILMRVFYHNQDFATMAEMLTAFADFFPNLADVQFNTATALRHSGQGDRAVPYFDRAIRLNPENAAYRTDFANSLQALGKHAEARAMIEEATRKGPNNPLAWYNRAIIERVQGRESDARDSMKKALEVAPRGPLGAVIRARARLFEKESQ